VRFIARRVGFLALTLWAALSLNFLLPRIMPGDPVAAAAGKLRGLPPQAIRAITIELGLTTHQSLASQYVSYLRNLATGDLGVSLANQQPVSSMIMQALPWTLGLVGLTTVLAFLLGTGIGALAAWKRGGRLDAVLPPVFVFISAVPYFWIGLMLIMIFSSILGWLPDSGYYDSDATPALSLSFAGDVLTHAILPSLTLLIASIGGWILTMRNTMVTTLTEDYVRMARAKGLPSRRIMLDYAARNAILPNLTGFAMSLGFVVSGAVLVEFVFNYQGVGYLLFNAVTSADYPMMQGLFLVITVAVLGAVVLSDIATAILDPRTRTGG